MVDTLADKWKFTPDEVKSMNEKGWAKLAADSGVTMPTTEAARARVVRALQGRLAGPAKNPLELLQSLKDSLAATAKK